MRNERGRIGLRRRLVAAGAALATGLSLAPGEVEAAGLNRFLGGVAIGLGAAAAGIAGVRIYGPRSTRGAARPVQARGGRSDRPAGEAAAPNERVLASLGSGGKIQSVVLKAISASPVLGVVGVNAESRQIGEADSRERERDYTRKVQDIIDRFKAAQGAAARDPASVGDVTAHAIERSLDRAFVAAKLDRFESFVGEDWSSERLRVMILSRVIVELDPLFRGNNRGMAPMETLDGLIKRASASVYQRLFEASELLASNRSTALFVRRVYEAHGGLMDKELREVADTMLSSAAAGALARFETGFRRDENGYALRYRAQRIVFDCLSENVEAITANGQTIAPIGEIRRRLRETALGECQTWLGATFGDEKGALKPQIPMPLRVVWAASGPKDLPSMYGRASGSF